MVKSGINTSIGDEEKKQTLNFNVNLFISKEWLLELKYIQLEISMCMAINLDKHGRGGIEVSNFMRREKA